MEETHTQAFAPVQHHFECRTQHCQGCMPGKEEARGAPLLRVLSELRMPLVTAVAADRAAATRLS